MRWPGLAPHNYEAVPGQPYIEVLEESPTQRYSAGVLFPQRQATVETDDSAQPDEVSIDSDADEMPVEPIEGDEQPEAPRDGTTGDSLTDAYADGDVSPDQVPVVLQNLTKDYGQWIADQESEVGSLSSRLQTPARENLKHCRKCLTRIDDGIELLRSDSQMLEAFSRRVQRFPTSRYPAVFPPARCFSSHPLRNTSRSVRRTHEAKPHVHRLANPFHLRPPEANLARPFGPERRRPPVDRRCEACFGNWCCD